MGNYLKDRGRFTISFDCEGKWGVADQGDRTLAHINGADLRDAYRRILVLLKQYEIPATFGLVGALCLDPYELKSRVDAIPSLDYCGRDWLLSVRKDIKYNNFDGWSHPEILEMLMCEENHELCSHGGFHIPYDEDNTPMDSVRTDLALISDIKEKHQIEFKNIILPRNVIGYRELLYGAGFKGYREIDVRELGSGLLHRLKRLSHEFMSDDLGDVLPVNVAPDFIQPISLSPAKFLNARIGVRTIVPSGATLWRIRRFVDRAIAARLGVHFYTHPHNFIRDKDMFEKFEKVLKLVSSRRDSGSLGIITMEEELEERRGISN